MDTIHDIPARQEGSGGVAHMAQTIAMLADTLARQRSTPRPLEDRATDALSRGAAARADAATEQRAAAYDLTTPDKPATPTVDEHAVASVAGLEHAGRAQRETATATAALAEAHESIAAVKAVVSQVSVSTAAPAAASSHRQPILVGRSR